VRIIFGDSRQVNGLVLQPGQLVGVLDLGGGAQQVGHVRVWPF
jgi:hypothetical protein